jgi:hypothetical protein
MWNAALQLLRHVMKGGAVLRWRFVSVPTRDLKALLAGMPPGDIDLERPRDMGRTVDL